MKKFIQENPTIAYGLGLPLLLVIIFLLVSGVPNLLVAKPQYELLYATETNSYPGVLQFTVVEQKVQVVHQGPNYSNQRPRMWRYNPQTGGVQEIGIVLPPELATNNNATAAPTPVQTILDVPDLADVRVNSSSVAPDGYEFVAANNRYSRNVFGGLFYSSRYTSEAVLTKNGRSIRLPNTDGNYYSRNPQFIGWILPQ